MIIYQNILIHNNQSDTFSTFCLSHLEPRRTDKLMVKTCLIGLFNRQTDILLHDNFSQAVHLVAEHAGTPSNNWLYNKTKIATVFTASIRELSVLLTLFFLTNEEEKSEKTTSRITFTCLASSFIKSNWRTHFVYQLLPYYYDYHQIRKTPDHL